MDLFLVALFLGAAVFAAPLAKRLGIGSVLGYLFAGILIGPSVLGVVYSVYQVDSVLHIAEFGVVMLLFLIGLELKPIRLWALRSAVFGFGGTQVLVTTAIVCAIALALGQPFKTALFPASRWRCRRRRLPFRCSTSRCELTTARPAGVFRPPVPGSCRDPADRFRASVCA